MCGIAGIALRDTASPRVSLEDVLATMLQAQEHRGPDDSGLYVAPDGRTGIGNQRLAIRDISPAGHMPMANSDGTVWITYNGEIYNTPELRPDLERRGHTFVSTSDTEVVLHGYEEWGAGVVERLRGIFAFGILDRRTQDGCLVLARDRLGVKPLYYAQTDSEFLFASEIKSIRTSNMVSSDISPAGLVGYLMFGSVPSPLTILRDVRALEPGCIMTLPLGHGGTHPEVSRYWSLPHAEQDSPSRNDTIENVRCLLQESVRTELVSDVPLGAFLSGGLDSSSVVALMREATDGPIRTCSMIFEEAEYSEARYARAMAKAVEAEHYERVVTADDVAQQLDRILWAMDQPTVDGVNTYFVSQTAREAGLTVSLSGLGGDELFGGYRSTFRGVPQTLTVLRTIHAVPGGSALGQKALDMLPQRDKWARMNDALGRPISPESAYLARRGVYGWNEVKALVPPDVWDEAVRIFDPVHHISNRMEPEGNGTAYGRHPFGWISRAELSIYTQAQLLRDTDCMSMVHSLEVRVPFLDHRLVEAVLTLKPGVQTANGRPKTLLVAAMEGLLPSVILDRTDKQGFTFPFDRWLRGPLEGKAHELLAEVTAEGWLRPAAVQNEWNSFRTGRMHWSRIWGLAVLHSVQASR